MAEWLSTHQAPCLFKMVFGFECPTCGMQTALILLLKGELLNSLSTYPPLIPTLLLIFMSLSWLMFRKPRWIFLETFIYADLGFILLNYVFILFSSH